MDPRSPGPSNSSAEVLRRFGLDLPAEPIPDGAIHRVRHQCRRSGDDAGWYVYHSTPIARLAFGCWRCCPETQHWTGGDAPLNHPQREAIRRASRDRARQIEAARRAVAEQVRHWIQSLVAADPKHPYLVRKAIEPHGALQHGELLVLPLLDVAGSTWSAQVIAPQRRSDWGDRDKSFERGGRVSGCFFPIGDFQHADMIVVCEGFATGASIAEVTGLPVACAMFAGNLEPVATALTERYHAASLIIAADNDRQTPGNPGLTKARETAKRLNALVAVPEFGDAVPASDRTDFNDLRRLLGDEAVRQAFDQAGTPGRREGAEEPRAVVVLPNDQGTEMPGFLDELGDALASANQRRGSPRYLARGDELVLYTERGRASRLLTATEHLIRAELQRDVQFVRQQPEPHGLVSSVMVGVIPHQIARDIARTPAVAVRLPPVDGISGCPILDRQGALTVSGYAGGPRLICACDPWDLDEPSLVEARDRLLGLIADYRFVSAADQARAMASLLQPALVMGQHVERGPAMLVVADQPSTGKGTLVAQRCALYGATATAVAMREQGGVGSLDEDLSVLIVQGALFVNLDNARGAIRSQILEACLTEPLVTLRVPFRPPVAVDPRKLNLSITSNGVSLTPDLALRCGIIRLRKQEPGYQFRTPRPVASAVADRVRLLSAVFAILRDWLARGAPRASSAYDGHARDFWAVVDEIVPRVFELPRPTQGLRVATQAGTDPLVEFLRAVGLLLKQRGEIPSAPLTAVQLLRLAGEEGLSFEGRAIPLEDEEKLNGLAAMVGRRATRRFAEGPLVVEEFEVRQRREMVRRCEHDPGVGTYPLRVYEFTRVDEAGKSDGKQGLQHGQQQRAKRYKTNNDRRAILLPSAATVGESPVESSEEQTTGLTGATSAEAGERKPSTGQQKRGPGDEPVWWGEFVEKWVAEGRNRSVVAVGELLAGYGSSMSEAVARGWLEITAQRVTLGPVFNGRFG